MIIRNTIASLATIFLVTISTQASASRHTTAVRLDNFCDTRYCGYITTSRITKYRHYSYHRHHHKKKIAKVVKKPVQVASLTPVVNEEIEPKKTSLLEKALSYMGTNPTGWQSLWCAHFIAYLSPATAETLKRMGLNPNWARDYALLPGARETGRVGDIVVLRRGRGGHIGIVEKFDKNGNPVIISGNHGHKVGRGTYPKSRIIAYASI